MPLFQIPEPLTVISPHLDDAVFSCGALLAAAQDAVVVTVLAGVPDAPMDLPDWDRAAGFSSVAQAVSQRRREDARGLNLLGARPEWLGFLDGQYGPKHTAEDIMAGLAASPSMQRGGTVVAPMGLFHSDHVLVGKACMLLRATVSSMQTADTAEDGTPVPPVQWLFYEDAIYRRLPGMVQSRLMGWWQAGLIAAPVQFPLVPWQSMKMAAVEAYESQLPLFNAGQLADTGAPERYWSLDIVPARGA
jgi:LmbE family N-acetylglucosaminyl deacetylase